MSDDQPAKDKYNPADHLMKVSGKDYLPVAARLRWFRDEWPAGCISMQHIEITDLRAIFKAAVLKVDGEGTIQGTSEGYGSETPKDFPDYIEKASTKALGRALAALGYGTSDIGDEVGDGPRARIVDAPIDFAARRQPATTTARPSQPQASPNNPITDPQLKFLIGLAKDQGMVVIGPDGDEHHDEAAMNAAIRQWFNDPATALTKLTAKEASELIEEWKARPKVARR